MMKRKVIVCDVCDKEITYEKHYKFNRYSFPSYVEGRVKDRFDMCEECFNKLREFVKIGDKNKNG